MEWLQNMVMRLRKGLKGLKEGGLLTGQLRRPSGTVYPTHRGAHPSPKGVSREDRKLSRWNRSNESIRRDRWTSDRRIREGLLPDLRVNLRNMSENSGNHHLLFKHAASTESLHSRFAGLSNASSNGARFLINFQKPFIWVALAGAILSQIVQTSVFQQPRKQ